uniref:Transketolase n=1 Tax=Candidatus Kentrum sp. LPFa TaxID=2126335 RepID=A0A450X909_9GAMM|nr:MAG: transketolase [Candidatus Kentron sp. LPFa]VFK25775.1 MAG: transketolase [Candidatus Kentron sp. LPFa]
MHEDFEKLLQITKLRLLKMHYQSNCGHLGGNFSCIDIIMTLYHCVMAPEDRFILSKGHSAGALYVTLWSQGKINDSDLCSFSQDNTLFPGHPSGTGIPGLLFSTGSLGHGPSLAAGLALAAKHRKASRNVYCLCSDGEWQEGSCWEALTFAVHQGLGNLSIIIDQNGLQGFGKTAEIISCGNLAFRIESFGANVHLADGHNISEIERVLKNRSTTKPNVIIFNTLKGKDLHFEGKVESHYLPLNEKQYKAACLKIGEGMGL